MPTTHGDFLADETATVGWRFQADVAQPRPKHTSACSELHSSPVDATYRTVSRVSVIFAYAMVAGTAAAGVNCAGLQNLRAHMARLRLPFRCCKPQLKWPGQCTLGRSGWQVLQVEITELGVHCTSANP